MTLCFAGFLSGPSVLLPLGEFALAPRALRRGPYHNVDTGPESCLSAFIRIGTTGDGAGRATGAQMNGGFSYGFIRRQKICGQWRAAADPDPRICLAYDPEPRLRTRPLWIAPCLSAILDMDWDRK
jgi:hypothetical protein